MKVLMITVFPPMKAPEADHALHLCEHLAGYGVEMHVIAQKGCAMLQHPRVTVYPIMQDWSWLELPRLARCISKCSPDAVILVYLGWVYNEHPMITFVPTITRILKPGLPFVTLVEYANGANPRRTSFLSQVIRKALALWLAPDVDYGYGTLLHDSDRLIVVSDRTRNALAERFSGVNKKSVSIPAPPIMRISLEDDGTVRRQTRDAIGLRDDEFLIAYFGYVYQTKGLETLLQAFQIVNARRRPARLILVGGELGPSSYLEKIHAMPKDLGIEDKVIWTGEYSWDSDHASRYLRAADICVLPFDKGVCVHNSSLAGASAHGLPIITTEGSITEPLFRHQKNVFLCSPKNPEALAAAIETVMGDSALRERLKAGARNLAQEYYSWEKATELTLEALAGSSLLLPPRR